jgi:hypothetical protein
MSQSTNVNNQIACIPPVFSFFPFQDSAKSLTRRLRKKVSIHAFCAEFGAARGGRGEKKGCPHPNVHFGCDIIMTEPVPMLLTLNWGGSSTHGIGDDVQFVGLQSRGDLNGKNGQVISWIESRWRYGVRVNGTGEEIAAKPENIVSSQAILARTTPRMWSCAQDCMCPCQMTSSSLRPGIDLFSSWQSHTSRPHSCLAERTGYMVVDVRHCSWPYPRIRKR